MRDEQQELGRRVREVRVERFGERGVPIVADLLCVPARTWRSFEAGARIPDPAIRRFIELTGTSPRWLNSSGTGSPGSPSGTLAALPTPVPSKASTSRPRSSSRLSSKRSVGTPW